MDKETLEKRLKELETHLEATKQTFHQFLGAIAIIKELLKSESERKLGKEKQC